MNLSVNNHLHLKKDSRYHLTQPLSYNATNCLLQWRIIFCVSSRQCTQTENFPYSVNLGQTAHYDGLGVGSMSHLITAELFVRLLGVEKTQTGISIF